MKPILRKQLVLNSRNVILTFKSIEIQMIKVKEEDKFKNLTPIYVPINKLETLMIYDKPNMEVRLVKFIEDEAERKTISKKIITKRKNAGNSPQLDNFHSASNKSLHYNSETCSPVTNMRGNQSALTGGFSNGTHTDQ